MHTKDFIAQVEQLEHVLRVDWIGGNKILVKNADGECMVSINTKDLFVMDSEYGGFRTLSERYRCELMHLVWQYISTPVDEREPEGRYTLSVKSHVPIVLLDVEKYYRKIWKDSDFRKQQLKWIEMTFDKEWLDEYQ